MGYDSSSVAIICCIKITSLGGDSSMFEVLFKVHDRIVKKIILSYDKDRCIIQSLELRDGEKKDSVLWHPVYVKVHDRFYDARLEFIGLVAEAAYENANNTTDTSRENIFVRGSLGHTRRNGAIQHK